jgi:hypothetical protein
MAKSLFYRIFHSSQLPDEKKQRLLNDNLVYLEESIRYSITYRHYKSPGFRYGYKKNIGKASIGYSTNFFIAATQFNPFIDMLISHEKFSALTFEIGNNNLLIKYNAAEFSDQRKQSGEVELRFRLANIIPFMKFIKS